MFGKKEDFLNLFESTLYPNLKVKFNGLGCEVIVSLNIEKSMIKHLSQNNIYKGNKMLVYAYRKQLTEVNYRNIVDTYNELLTKLQIKLREAKQKVLEDEILMLKEKREWQPI